MFIFQLLTDEFNIYQSSFYLYINLKELSDLLLEQSNLESVSQRSQDNCQLVPVIPQMITPDSGVGVEGLVGGLVSISANESGWAVGLLVFRATVGVAA